MQLSDIFDDSDATDEAMDEVRFQQHLKKLDKLPTWKKKEVETILKKQDFSFFDIVKIFNENEAI